MVNVGIFMYIYTTHGCYWSVAEQDQSMATLIYGNGMVLIEICAMHANTYYVRMYVYAGWWIGLGHHGLEEKTVGGGGINCPVGGGIMDVS